jgi:membrane-associated phospholipid phosphatase
MSVAARVGVAAGLLFTALTVAILSHATVVQGLDDVLHGWIVGHRPSLSVSLARVVTWGGATAFVLPALVVVGVICLRRGGPVHERLAAGLLLAMTAAAGVYVGLLVNSWVGRARPPVPEWAGAAGGPSFPSGHTTAATIFALCSAWALTARTGPGRSRTIVWTCAVVWAVTVGWSRVWLGVHWPSDVVGGFLCAVAWCALSLAALQAAARRAAQRKSPRIHGVPSVPSSSDRRRAVPFRSSRIAATSR